MQQTLAFREISSCVRNSHGKSFSKRYLSERENETKKEEKEIKNNNNNTNRGNKQTNKKLRNPLIT